MRKSDPDSKHFGKSLENGFYFVVFVAALCFNVEVALGCIAKRFKKVHEHFCGHVSNSLSVKSGIPYQPWSATKVYGYLG